jgi:hypothetical protein
MKMSVISSFVATLMLFSQLAIAASGGGAQPFDPGEKVYGKTYSEWAEAWTDWAYSYPLDTSPILDETGASCAQGQKGKVWFLAGSFFNDPPIPIERDCNIPAGKALFFPIVNTFTFKPEFPDPGQNPQCLDYETDIEQLRCDIQTDLLRYGPDPDALLQPVLSVEVNGVPIADPFGYRVESAPGGYKYEVLEGSLVNQVGYASGPREPAIVGGYWVMLPALGPGKNVVRIYAQNVEGAVLDVTYYLNSRGERRCRGHQHCRGTQR